MSWLYYLAEANLYLSVFYLAYCIFLSKETHYQLNRAYLLAACIVACLIPLVQLGFLKPVVYIVKDAQPGYESAPTNVFDWQGALVCLYILGVIIFAGRFVLKLHQLRKLMHTNPVAVTDSYKLVSLPGADTAFSFFDYLFIGTQSNEQSLIIRHELVHIRQKHSIDIVSVEVLQVVSWFNPIVYLLQNSLKTIHEYIADEQTSQSATDTIAYATYLLNHAYGNSGPEMTHSFFNSNLLKKRITMLHQKRSGNLARLKYLIAVPLCAALLCQSTFGFSKTYALINIAPKAAIVVNATDTIPGKKALKEITIDEPVSVEKPPKSEVKGMSAKKMGSKHVPLANVEKTIQDGVNGIRMAEQRSTFSTGEPKAEIRIEEPQQKSEIRVDEPASEIRIEEPVQKSPKKLPPPPPPPLQNSKKTKVVDEVVLTPPKPDVKKVKFPPLIVRPDRPVKKNKPVKFPPPVVKPDPEIQN